MLSRHCLLACLLATSVVSQTITCISAGAPVLSVQTACNFLTSAYSSCNTATGSALDKCVCQPSIFEAIYNCQSEDRECFNSYDLDDEAESVLSNWHEQCDGFTTTPFSTPVLRTPTSTIIIPEDTQACTSIKKVCETAYSIEACYTQFPAVSQDAQFKSCACIPEYYTAASVCEYDGNVTCFSRPATRASIGLWHVCGITELANEPASSALTTVPLEQSSTTIAASSTAESGSPVATASTTQPTGLARQNQAMMWQIVFALFISHVISSWV